MTRNPTSGGAYVRTRDGSLLPAHAVPATPAAPPATPAPKPKPSATKPKRK